MFRWLRRPRPRRAVRGVRIAWPGVALTTLFLCHGAAAAPLDAPTRAYVDSLQRQLRDLHEWTPAVEQFVTSIDSMVQVTRGQGEYAEERALLAAQLAARRRFLPPGHPDIAATASRVGFANYRMHDHAAAAAAWRDALTLLAAAPAPDHKWIVRNQKFLADAERLLGHFGAAESLLVGAIARSKEHLPQDTAHATLLNNLGALYWDQDRLDEAERLYRDAIRISEADPKANPAHVATEHLNLGVLLRDQDRVAEAEPLLTQALAEARAAIPRSDPGLVLFPHEAARLQAAAGHWDGAIALWNDALDLVTHLAAPHPIYQAEILYDLGRAHLQSKQYARAEARLREARRLQQTALGAAHPELAMTQAALAEVLVARRGPRNAEALTLTTSAIDVLARSPMAPEARAAALALRARCERARGRAAAARADLQAALEIVEEIRPRRGAVDVARTGFMARYAAHYDDLIGWLLDEGQSEAALQWAERRRARVLRDRLTAAHIDPRHDVAPGVLAPLAARERGARRRLQGLQAELAAARSAWTPPDAAGAAAIQDIERDLDAALREQQAAEAEIHSHSRAWSQALRAPGIDLTARSVQDALIAPDAVLLEYQVGAHRSHVFVIPPAPAAIECYPLQLTTRTAAALGVAAGAVTDSLLSQWIEDALDPNALAKAGLQRRVTGVAAVQAADSAAARTPAPTPAAHTSAAASAREVRATALFDVLIPQAVRARLKQAREVILVPDGPLHALPFEALVVHGAGAAGTSPTYWLDEGPPVRYAHSISTLLAIAARPARQRARATSLLTVSDPDFGPGPAGRPAFPRLPGTARESAALRQAFPQASIVDLERAEATESRVKQALPAARLVHLATHGIVDEKTDALLGALLFAPEPGDPAAARDDGWLHLFEVYDLDLDCDLAVLSACDTEAGKRVQGEGTFALSRGFLAAGARRTLASRWPVADESTAALIAKFFQGLAAAETAARAGGPAPDYAALMRVAQLQVRQDPRWAAPYYWSAFALAGVR